MNIVIKLVGHIITEDKNKYIYELKLSNVKEITYDIIKTLFLSYGLEEEDFDNISITCDYQNLKNHIRYY